MNVVQPGSWLGVFGGGQLGRMFAQAAATKGYRVHVFTDTEDSVASEVACRTTVASYHDLQAVQAFAQSVSAITIEFENIPYKTLDFASKFVEISPKSTVLQTLQDRRLEKGTLRESGIKVTPFSIVESSSDVAKAASCVGFPGVLKSAFGGYDGHSQILLPENGSVDDLQQAWERLGKVPSIYEAFVDYRCEISVVAARSYDGRFYAFPVFQNHHSDHILDTVFCPANLSENLYKLAYHTTRHVGDSLGVVGTYCVEYFVTRSGDLFLNEVAPRPHNSGHLTIELSTPSQFDLQVRTLCGYPLPRQDFDAYLEGTTPGAMVNLLGKHLKLLYEPEHSSCTPGPEVQKGDTATSSAEHGLNSIFLNPNVSLHLYGKTEIREKRKMGHISCITSVEKGSGLHKQSILARSALDTLLALRDRS